MKIHSIKLKNFRGYTEETEIKLENLTAFVGKNDAGKSTILEALDIFLNEGKGVVKFDINDINVSCRESGDCKTEITVIFDNLPSEIIIDSTARTTLQSEHLLNVDGHLEISKVWQDGGKPKILIIAEHPTNGECAELLYKKNNQLRAIIESKDISCENVTINSAMRDAIRGHYSDELNLETIKIDASKEDAKVIWTSLSKYLPLYTLFQSDRANTDGDSEVQDPLKTAVKAILMSSEIQDTFAEVSEQVLNKLREVSDRTLEKLKEIDENIADELKPAIPEADKLKWYDVFKDVSIYGDNKIPINKRGSGVKRLILLSFFRGEAERLALENARNGIIYAIEEPETSQHTNNQKLLIEAFKSMAEEGGAQILLTTHSPEMVKCLDFHNIRIIDIKNETEKVKSVSEASLNYPSLNEVNYLAFYEITEEYHNELYGLIEAYKQLQGYFSGKPLMPYNRQRNNGTIKEEKICLSQYIRHQIHHPENPHNIRFTDEQLEESINLMREYVIANKESFKEEPISESPASEEEG